MIETKEPTADKEGFVSEGLPMKIWVLQNGYSAYFEVSGSLLKKLSKVKHDCIHSRLCMTPKNWKKSFSVQLTTMVTQSYTWLQRVGTVPFSRYSKSVHSAFTDMYMPGQVYRRTEVLCIYTQFHRLLSPLFTLIQHLKCWPWKMPRRKLLYTWLLTKETWGQLALLYSLCRQKSIT